MVRGRPWFGVMRIPGLGAMESLGGQGAVSIAWPGLSARIEAAYIEP